TMEASTRPNSSEMKMIPDDTIFEKLSAWQPYGTGPHSLQITLPHGTLDLTAQRADELSCQLTDLRLTGAIAEPCSATQLKDRAIKTAERVSHLLEPLNLYEADANKSMAIVRSTTPTERGGELFYYELTLTGLHSANLKRFKADKSNAKREAVPFVLT